ncbi:hypothetical protein WA026_003474, partial [Henosepilachna vigintioctopunctata]
MAAKNVESLVPALIHNFLSTVDKNFAKDFQKKFQFEKLSKTSPSLLDIVSHYVKTESHAKKLNLLVGNSKSNVEEKSKPTVQNGIVKHTKQSKTAESSSSEDESPKKSTNISKVSAKPVTPVKKAESSSDDSSDDEQQIPVKPVSKQVAPKSILKK